LTTNLSSFFKWGSIISSYESVKGTFASYFKLGYLIIISWYSSTVSKVSNSVILFFIVLKTLTEFSMNSFLCYKSKGHIYSSWWAPKQLKNSLSFAYLKRELTIIVTLLEKFFYNCSFIFIFLLFSSSKPSKNSKICLSSFYTSDLMC
jgi:hypothetical protein